MVKNVLWCVSWFLLQRVLMAINLMPDDTWFNTFLFTMLMFFFCYFSRNSWGMVFYLPTVIVGGIRIIQRGYIITAVLFLIFHLGLFYAFHREEVKAKKKTTSKKVSRRRSTRT